MAKLIRVFDPDDTERRINLVIQEDACPGLLEFLAGMPYRTETPLIRGIVYQWFLKNRDAGTLDSAISEALEGLGGLIEAGPSLRQEKKTGSRGRSAKAVRPRNLLVKPQARHKQQPAPEKETLSSDIDKEAAKGPVIVNREQQLNQSQQAMPEAASSSVQKEPVTTTEAPPPITQSTSDADKPSGIPIEQSPAKIDPSALVMMESLDDMFP